MKQTSPLTFKTRDVQIRYDVLPRFIYSVSKSEIQTLKYETRHDLCMRKEIIVKPKLKCELWQKKIILPLYLKYIRGNSDCCNLSFGEVKLD